MESLRLVQNLKPKKTFNNNEPGAIYNRGGC